ncbi:tenascin isoform X1 [Danio rerio]|uniref:Tenascin isoform X1 n=2 Tax=Danio rerio TaxID=7955 RepID=A0AB32TRK9_DANRE|nr:tenascin-like isoform X1 [Danio rerio]|eukprot:XP_021332057.1 tenascin-like isoform X1 [Danio rerio]
MSSRGLTLSCLLLITLMALNHAGLVKKLIRQRREALNVPGIHNVTLSNSSRPVIFNHVYNIKVPGSPLCSVDLDAPEGSDVELRDAPSEHSVDGSNQIVFTHRINIPKQACGCTDGLPDLKDLLSRLEMLEGEVSTLREQCGAESTCCSAQVTGAIGTKPFCSGHGNYSTETCGCVCAPGWKGLNCTIPDCPGDCSDQGRCVNGKCECFEGFTGDDCSTDACLIDCGDNGRCLNGKCVCSEGFSGEYCTESDCLNNCLGRGRCVDGECVCDEPWTGFDCSELICPNDCYDRGRCENGTCYCDRGFTGEDCGALACPNDCSGRGFCIDGRCVCDAGYTGEDCSSLTCPNNCNDRGRCSNGVCICEVGFHGEDCGRISCPSNCNNRGHCVDGRCECDVGFQGHDCSELSCPNNCNNRGRCVNGQCVCDEGFGSEDCGLKTCPSDCYGRGQCVDGECVCFANFAGEDCSELRCPNSCQNRGRCIAGQCVCDEGFTGEDCSQRKCPNDCLGRGRCVDGRCVCQDGFKGQDCSVPTCPGNCNDHGRCVNGKCVCDEGFFGDACSDRSCLNDCSDVGQCVDGRCICDEGYIGEDCSDVSPPEDLTVTDVSTQKVNLTWRNEMLVTEYLITYVPTAPGGLQMDFRVAGDRTSATVSELEPGIEYLINVYAVLNNKRSIPVSARVATYLPQPEGLRFTSITDSTVEVVWEQLNFPFDGWELIFRNTKEENGKIVNNLTPSQTTFEQQGLGPGQEYEVTLSVIKNNTRGPETSSTVVTRIDSPAQIEVADVTDRSAVISWSKPLAPVDGFKVSYGPSTDPLIHRDVELSASETQYSLEDLKPDTQYRVALSSQRGDVTSEPIIESFTTGLDAPSELRAVDQTDSSITLEWKNSRSSIDGYRIKYGPIAGGAHGEDMFPKKAGDTTWATITGLKPGTEYGIGVTAVQNERESEPATTNALTDLDPPRDLEVQSSTETSVDLVWKRPRAKISTYRLAYVSVEGRREEIELPASASTSTLSGLMPGMSYTVTLVAERGHRRSAPATVTASTASFTFYLANAFPEFGSAKGADDNIISFVSLENSETPFSGSGLEDPIGGSFTISNVSSHGFDLMWDSNKLSGFDSFTVEVTDFSGMWKEEVHLNGKVNDTKIRGLKSSTEYQVRLYGLSNNQRSSLLEAVAVTAPKSTSPDVVALTVKRVSAAQPSVSTSTLLTEDFKAEEPLSDLKVTEVGANSLRLSWQAPERAFSSFIIELNSTSNTSKDSIIKVSGEARHAHVEGLNADMNYEITLYGRKAGEKSQPISVFVKTEEQKPQIGSLSLSDVSWDSFNVSWIIEDGPAFDSFVIEVANSAGPERQNLSVSGDARDLWMSGLSPGTSYMITLYGVHQGSILGSINVEAATDRAPAMGNLYVSNVTSQSFFVSWNDTKGEIERFVLEIIDSSWQQEPIEYNLSQSVQSYEITGLRPTTDYIAYVTGVMKGRRTDSVSAVASTAAEPDLSGLVVSNVTSDSVSLSWRTGEKAFDNFIVEVRESALPSQASGRTFGAGVRSAVLNGLRGNTTYQIKLYATVAGANTDALTTVVTTEPKPELGRVVVSERLANSLTLSWSTLSGHFDGFAARVSDREQLYDVVELRLSGTERNTSVQGLVDSTVYDIMFYGVSHGRQTPSVYFNTSTASLPKVENLTVWDVTPYGFRVSWDADSGFSHFQVKVSDSGQLLEPQELVVPGNEASLEVLGLITGIGYEVSVTGVSGTGLRSRPITTVAVTEAEPEIEHLFVSDVTPESFRLSWTTEDDVFDRFVLKVRDSRKLSHPREFSMSGDERTKVLTQLLGGTEYEIELYGVTLERRSQPVTAVVKTGLGALRDLHFSDITDTSAVVYWTLPRAQPDSYRITLIPIQGGSPMIVQVDGSQSQVSLRNLIPGETYQVSVIAVKGLEESEPVSDTFTTALDTPRSLTVVNVTDSSALLFWQPAVATVDGYMITYSADTVPPISEQVSGNTVEFEMNSLAPATQYTVSVYAIRDREKSLPATADFTTDVDAPRDLVASNIQTDSAVLSWTPPRAAITGYTLTFQNSDADVREVIVDPSVASHTLSNLRSTTKYTVILQAVSEDKRSRSISTEFTTVGMLYGHPRDCSEALLNGETSSGPYTIYINGDEKQPLRVYCDMTTDGGGWMLFLRRQSGKLNFYRNWRNYSAGFGDTSDEFWLGLSNLHKITAAKQYEIRVDLRDGSETVFAVYDRFYIGDPRSRYKIQIGAYSGTAGDSLTYHQNRPFSTYDSDNDIAITNCALSYKGAFWYKNCHRVNLMGKYGDSSHSKGINWFHWKGHEHSIPFAEMKIRPANFRNLEGRRKRS